MNPEHYQSKKSQSLREGSVSPILPLRRLEPDEVACTGFGVHKFLIGDMQELRIRLARVLPADPRTSRSDELTVRVAEKVLTLYRRLSGPHTVWAAKVSDKEVLASLLETSLRSAQVIARMRINEIAISQQGLRGQFIGDENTIAKRVQGLLPEVYSYPGDKKSIAIGRESFQFVKRKNGSHIVWALSTRDRKRLGEALGLKEKKTIGDTLEDEISVSVPGLKEIYVGNEVHKAIGQYLPKNPQTATKDSIRVSIQGETFNFYRRLNHAQYVWAFASDDIDRLGEAFGLVQRTTRHSLREGEISCSVNGLSPFCVGDPGKVASRVNDFLSKYTNSKIIRLKQGSDKVNLFRRRVGPREVWAFQKQDLDKFARILDLRLRESEFISSDLIDAVALLGSDPVKLHQYIKIFHSELSEDASINLTLKCIEGLGGSPGGSKIYEGFKEELDAPLFIEPLGKRASPVALQLHLCLRDEENHLDRAVELALKQKEVTFLKTEENSFTLKGKVNKKTEYVYVEGAYTRKVRVDSEGYFEARIPVPKTGGLNYFLVYAINSEAAVMSAPAVFAIQQIGTPENIEEAFLALIGKRDDLLREIKNDPKRSDFLQKQIELSLLKSFTASEDAGMAKLERRIAAEGSAGRKAILVRIRDKFEVIKDHGFGIVEGHRLYFFQKYTIHEALTALRRKEPGIIIANEQGLGKTVTALALVSSEEATVVAPNAVVTTWASEERRFLPLPQLVIPEGRYADRDSMLDLNRPGKIVANVEYTRGLTKTRKAALSRPDGVLIIDEADYLGTRASQQSQGTREIDARFKVLLSATPFKRHSQIGTVLSVISPKDNRFNSAVAFARAFPASSPKAMNALHLLMNERTIRIRKLDVFESYDPKKPLEKQKDKLPAKRIIAPEKDGRFTLAPEQCRSILELFTKYQAWCKKHRGHESSKDKEYSRYSEGYFAKKEAIRQIMNDPAYIGRPDIESPKHLKMDEIVNKELQGRDRKLVIFCRYKEQVEEYARRYAKYGARTYYGDLPQNADGYRIDENEKLLFYLVDKKGEFELDTKGYPIETESAHGKPMRVLDYEKILFQNCPANRVMIATYDSGAVGVTFTAADAVIFDDLAPSYRDEYQAGERAHRIDNLRKKYAINYYWLLAEYPQAFLDEIKGTDAEKYFKPGTFDSVMYDNIRLQGRIFHRIMDGVGSEAELLEIESMLSAKMPFLFEKRDERQIVAELMGDLVPESELVPRRDRREPKS